MPRDLIDAGFRYFPFVGFLFSLLYWLALKSKMPPAIKIYLAAQPLQFGVWGLLQLAGGYRSFYFILLPAGKHPLVAIFWILSILIIWAETIWIVWGKGTDQTLRYGLWHGDQKLKQPQFIKLFHILISILLPFFVIFGNSFGWFASWLLEIERIYPVR